MFNRDIILPAIVPDSIPSDGPGGADRSTFAFLSVPAIWWCFAFFVFVSAAIGTAQNFAPTIFEFVYGLDVSSAALSVTIMMLASAAGMGLGGWLVVRSAALERNITVALGFGLIGSLIIGMGWASSAAAFLFIGAVGFGIGLSGPSRDMLIRSATPPGATGRVYGVVYSGLDVGIALAPVAFRRHAGRGIFSRSIFWYRRVFALGDFYRMAGREHPHGGVACVNRSFLQAVRIS